MMTIMNCEDCGAGLLEWDFHRKRARLVENRPYCTDCRPAIGSSGEPLLRPSPRPPAQRPRTLPANRTFPS